MNDWSLDHTKVKAAVREVFPPPPPLAGWLGFYYDSSKAAPEDAGWFCSGKVHPNQEEALCELAGFRPFEGSALVEVGEASALFAPAPEKVECPNCHQPGDHTEHTNESGFRWTCQPAPPEPAAPRSDGAKVLGTMIYRHGNGPDEYVPAAPEPASPEMPTIRPYTAKDVREWIRARGYLSVEQHNDFGRVLPTSNMGACMEALAEALEEIERHLAQPVAVGMTEELADILGWMDVFVRDGQIKTNGLATAQIVQQKIASVREQAGRAQRPKLELPAVRVLIRQVQSVTEALCAEGFAELAAALSIRAADALAEIDAEES